MMDQETLRSPYGALYALGKVLIVLGSLSPDAALVLLKRAEVLNSLRDRQRQTDIPQAPAGGKKG